LSSHDNVVPIPGTSNPKRLEENAGAVQIALSAQELAGIEQMVPKGVAAGARYDEQSMRLLNR
jgi:aryl-alcohol dehydrogenase-like predicted oxidoreductase